MKLPCRILGLIAAAAAAPVIVGCAGEPSEPSPNKTDQNIETQPTSEEKQARDDASEPQPLPPSITELPAVDAPDPSSAPPPNEEMSSPPDEAGGPVKGMPGASPAMPYGAGPMAPHFGSGGTGQDPCPACGMG